MIWGFMHGVANVFHRFWEGANIRLARPLAWLVTFSFVNVCWIFFRAKTLSDAVAVLKGMTGLNGLVLPQAFEGKLSFLRVPGIQFSDKYMANLLGFQEQLPVLKGFAMIAVFLLVCILLPNSDQLTERFSPNATTLILAVVIFVASILSMNHVTSFVYFNF